MEIEIGTPAVLFGAISLIFLAYTNRFGAVAKFVRELNEVKKISPHRSLIIQIKILRKRLWLIKLMQAVGVFSFILCTFSVSSIFFGKHFLGQCFFLGSIIALMISLSISLVEIFISTKALDLILDDAGNSSKK